MVHLAKEERGILSNQGRTTTLQPWVTQGAQYPVSQNDLPFIWELAPQGASRNVWKHSGLPQLGRGGEGCYWYLLSRSQGCC